MTKFKEFFRDENRFFSLLLLLCLIVLVVLSLVLGYRIIKIQESVVRIEDQIQQLIASGEQGNLPSSPDIVTYSGEMDVSIGHIFGEVQNPEVVIVEFLDFECPYCSQAPKLIDELIISNPGRVMVVNLDYPLPFHDNALGAALFANCVTEQNKISYDQISSHIFENQSRLDTESLFDFAKTLDINIDQLKQCMNSSEANESLNQSIAMGKNAGIKGTPAFIVSNNFDYDGNVLKIDGNLVYLSQLVESVRKLLNNN